MSGPVIVIGLDAAEPWVVDHYIAQGRMPVMKRLRETGAYGLVQNQELLQSRACLHHIHDRCLACGNGLLGPY